MDTESPRRLDSFRRGSRFRLAHAPERTGKLIDKSPSGCYVSLVRASEHSFTTGDGKRVTIRRATERMTISSETMVLPFRARILSGTTGPPEVVFDELNQEAQP